jgi:16S rRNA (adenine1518-N6/adenine1519-N6)-dimethyltransferase
MKLSEMKQNLAEGEIQLTKSLGQNFLHDQNQLRKIIDAAELNKADKVLEIGPGLGPLTELLVEEAGEVLAIEKDSRLLVVLQKRFAEAKNLTLLHADALEFLRPKTAEWTAWKVVANLPYSVASPILVELAEAHGSPERMVVTLQLEVVQRIVAQATHPNYGVLSLLLQLRYEPREWFKIPRGCFFPEPAVDSACVILVRRLEPFLDFDEAKVFTKIVKRAFSQRRKMMFKLLREDWPAKQLEAAFTNENLSMQIRAEDVYVEQFTRLTKNLLHK